MALSPIEIEVLRNALGSIVDEMYVALMRSAYSTNIKERRDHSTAIFDADGRIAVQGDSLPLHLASMLGLVEVVFQKFGREGIEPGDIFISNDPFVGRGSHCQTSRCLRRCSQTASSRSSSATLRTTQMSVGWPRVAWPAE